MADPWTDYLASQSQPQAAPAGPQQGGFLGMLLNSLMKRGGQQGGAGPGQVPRPDFQGMYTPGVNMAAAGPPTPINYGAIKSMLNTGVLRDPATAAPPPVAPAPAPAPVAPPKEKNPLGDFLGSLLGGIFG